MKTICITIPLLLLLVILVHSESNGLSDERIFDFFGKLRRAGKAIGRFLMPWKRKERTENVQEASEDEIVFCDTDNVYATASECALKVDTINGFITVHSAFIAFGISSNNQVILGQQVQEKLQKVCSTAKIPNYDLKTFKTAADFCNFQLVMMEEIHGLQGSTRRAAIYLGSDLAFPFRATRQQCQDAYSWLQNMCKTSNRLHRFERRHV